MDTEMRLMKVINGLLKEREELRLKVAELERLLEEKTNELDDIYS